MRLARRAKTLGRLAARVAAGTAVYAVIVVLAAPLPAAAGVMLTFPALNGLAFYFSEDERAAAIAKTMFWMPIVNGSLCAAYILAFIPLAGVLVPSAAGWVLLLIAATLWFAWVSQKTVRAGIESADQAHFAIAATFAGTLLAAAMVLAMAHFGSLPPMAASAASWTHSGLLVQAVAGSRLKIALFALTLAVLISAIQYFPISDSTRGILAGLPIVPFGGMVSIAGDVSLSSNAKILVFHGMIAGVWLGPAVALWYIFCFSRFLAARSKAGVPAADASWRFGALLVAWLVTFAVCVAIAYALEAFGVHFAAAQGTA